MLRRYPPSPLRSTSFFLSASNIVLLLSFTTGSIIYMSLMSQESSVTVVESSTSSSTPTVASISMATMTATNDTGSNTSAAVKTVFLVRHAESDENRRLHSLKTAFKDLTRFALPKLADLQASCELIHLNQQINSNVSPFGKEQIAFMANILRETNFLARQNIELLVHSPLIRAKETCRDMFGCILSNASDETSPLLLPIPPLNITEVIELDIIAEMTPIEWLPGNAGSLQNRMRALETWLSLRPETTIVCVGHSQYFKALLQLPYKFQNCDIIKVQFDPSNTTCKWSNIQDAHLCRLKKPSDNNTVNTSAGTDLCGNVGNTCTAESKVPVSGPPTNSATMDNINETSAAK